MPSWGSPKGLSTFGINYHPPLLVKGKATQINPPPGSEPELGAIVSMIDTGHIIHGEGLWLKDTTALRFTVALANPRREGIPR
jgi:hypothetical protein